MKQLFSIVMVLGVLVAVPSCSKEKKECERNNKGFYKVTLLSSSDSYKVNIDGQVPLVMSNDMYTFGVWELPAGDNQIEFENLSGGDSYSRNESITVCDTTYYELY